MAPRRFTVWLIAFVLLSAVVSFVSETSSSEGETLESVEQELRAQFEAWGAPAMFVDRWLTAAPHWAPNAAPANWTPPPGADPTEEELAAFFELLRSYQELYAEQNPAPPPPESPPPGTPPPTTTEQIVDALFSQDALFDCRPYLEDVSVGLSDPRQLQVRTIYGASDLPSEGVDFLVLSSGDPDAPTEGSDLDFGTAGCNGDSVEVTLTFDFPDDGSGESEIQALKLNFDFFSYEVPEFVGFGFNDYAFAYLDSAPPAIPLDGFCMAPVSPATGCMLNLDGAGNPTNVDSLFFAPCNVIGCDSPVAVPGWETTFDLGLGPGEDSGRTGTLTTCSPAGCSLPITPGTHTLTLLVGDVGDGRYQSTALFDNLRCFRDRQCDTARVTPNDPPEVVCLDPVIENSIGECTGVVGCDAVSSCGDPEGDAVTSDCDPAGVVAVGSSVAAVTCSDDADTVVVSCPVTVEDTEDPTATCPQDVELSCPADTDPAATGSPDTADNCDVASLESEDTFGDSPCELATGSLVRTWTTVDVAGNAGECDQVIDVTDSTDPSISVPGALGVECDTTGGVLVGNVAVQAWLDLAGGADTCSDVVVTNDASGLLPLGDTAVIFTAEDACGNTTPGSSTVTVVDATPPEIGCPADVMLACPADTTPPATGQATATDVCGIASLDFTDSSVPACGMTESITRTWTATDVGANSVGCAQTITVADAVPPTLAPPSPITLECNAEGGIPVEDAEVQAWLASAIGADACGGVTVTNDVAGQLALGDTVVTFTAEDECGNTTTASSTITVVDTTPPEISCPADMTLECPADTTPQGAGQATATDVCGIASLDFTDSSVPACGSTETITRTWAATDVGANTANCVQTITVVDTISPVLTPPGAITLECNAEGGIPVGDPDVQGWLASTITSDGCDDVFVTNNAPPFFDLGDTLVRFTAEDACGNTATATSTITVLDTIPPEIDCPADLTLECPADTTPAATGQATATDACGIASLDYSDSAVPACGATETISRTWTARDVGGNTVSCVQNITVTDTLSPTLTPPVPITLECDAPGVIPIERGDVQAWLVSTVTADGCGEVTVTNDAPLQLPLGATVVTFTAADECGNTTTAAATVTVVDTTPPEINCPLDVTLECPAVTTPAMTGQATATDGCGIASLDFTDISVPACGSTEAITRTWTATDLGGNSVSCVQMIVVADTTAPTIDTPDSITLELSTPDGVPAADSRVQDWLAEASAADSCGDATLTHTVPPLFPLGSTVVVFMAIDECGVPASAGSSVVVVDTTPPEVDCSFTYSGDDADDDSDDDEQRGVIEFAATDFQSVDTIAVVNTDPGDEACGSVEVTNGQLVELECGTDCEFEFEGPELEIEGPDPLLLVTATDASGNTASCGLHLCDLTEVELGDEDSHVCWNDVDDVANSVLVRGDLGQLAASGGGVSLGSVECLGPGGTTTSADDATVPIVGGAFFYVVRQTDAWGHVSFGRTSNGQPRAPVTDCE